MANPEVDLNVEPPDFDLNHSPLINWDDIEEWHGPAHELDYDMEWGIADGEGDGQDGGITDLGDGYEQGPDGGGDHGGEGIEIDEGSEQTDDGGGDHGADGIQIDQGSEQADDGGGDHGANGIEIEHDVPVFHAGGNQVGEDTDIEQGSNDKKRKFYSDDLKIAIYLELLAKTTPPTMKRGVTKKVAQKFDVPLRLVQQVWRNGQDYGGIEGVKNKLVSNCGRKKIEIDFEPMKAFPLQERTTLRDLAHALGVKKTTLHARLKEGYFRRHTNDLKFTLTDENKKARVRYCRSMIMDDLKFKPMYKIVYIDEKWFYRTRRNQKYYLANDENRPQREVKNKNFIEKVMFLAVVTRPRFDRSGNCIFDGKLGIFPFTVVEAAQRSSANRPKGTMVTKAMTSVNKETSRDFLINKVLPAIKAKWPAEDRHLPIFIQQDNAKTHVDVNDPEFVQAAQADGWDIRLTCQPPNSPDLNVLDLGFFAAIQALFHKGTPNNVDQIVQRVDQAFREYPVDRANRIFLTQQCCMMEIMKFDGGQHYNIPHMKKKTLEMQGLLPISLRCPIDLYHQATHFIC